MRSSFGGHVIAKLRQCAVAAPRQECAKERLLTMLRASRTKLTVGLDRHCAAAKVLCTGRRTRLCQVST